MLINHITKEKMRARRPKKLVVPALSFHVVDSASEEEIQRRLDSAFNILFTEVFKNINGVDKSI
ncbi:MAG: hypothetical protein WCG28_04750 [bacterium]